MRCHHSGRDVRYHHSSRDGRCQATVCNQEAEQGECSGLAGLFFLFVCLSKSGFWCKVWWRLRSWLSLLLNPTSLEWALHTFPELGLWGYCKSSYVDLKLTHPKPIIYWPGRALRSTVCHLFCLILVCIVLHLSYQWSSRHSCFQYWELKLCLTCARQAYSIPSHQTAILQGLLKIIYSSLYNLLPLPFLMIRNCASVNDMTKIEQPERNSKFTQQRKSKHPPCQPSNCFS